MNRVVPDFSACGLSRLFNSLIWVVNHVKCHFVSLVVQHREKFFVRNGFRSEEPVSFHLSGGFVDHSCDNLGVIQIVLACSAAQRRVQETSEP